MSGRGSSIWMRGCHSRGPGTGPVCVRSSTVRNVKTVNLPRSAGVQLHPTSLPGGRLGPEAYRFVDWLASARQSWWQMLPLGPPDRYGSPYKSPSAFAAWAGLLEKPRARVSAGEESAFRVRHAAGSGEGLAVGQPDLRRAGPAAAGLSLGDGAPAADGVAVRPGARGPLPRVRRVLGGAAGGARRPRRPVAARAGAGGLRGDGLRARSA